MRMPDRERDLETSATSREETSPCNRAPFTRFRGCQAGGVRRCIRLLPILDITRDQICIEILCRGRCNCATRDLRAGHVFIPTPFCSQTLRCLLEIPTFCSVPSAGADADTGPGSRLPATLRPLARYHPHSIPALRFQVHLHTNLAR